MIYRGLTSEEFAQQNKKQLQIFVDESAHELLVRLSKKYDTKVPNMRPYRKKLGKLTLMDWFDYKIIGYSDDYANMFDD